MVPAWAYQWLVAVPDVAGSWVLPLDVQRRGPKAKSSTQVALDQITNVAFCDGSVRSLSVSLSGVTLGLLSARNDRQPIPNF